MDSLSVPSSLRSLRLNWTMQSIWREHTLNSSWRCNRRQQLQDRI